MPDKSAVSLAIRGSILHCLDDPADGDGDDQFEYYEDGLLLVKDGRIAGLGEARATLPQLPADLVPVDVRGKLILPGFVDTHIHFVQTDIIGSYGHRLLDWLNEFTFPAERAFGDPAHASEVADFFTHELLRQGTTTAMVLGSSHRESVDAIFEAARTRGLRMIAGKIMMDRNCPDYLQDSAESSYADSKALIARWHDQDRLQYAVSPRFAPTSSEQQLQAAAQLVDEHPGVFFQTHLAENKEEVAWVTELFPSHRSYLDVYDSYGLLRNRSVLAHGIWLDDRDRRRLAETGAAIAHCPTANLFMGSGLFDLAGASRDGVAVALGTDVGGGTTFSMLRVMHEAYKVGQLLGQNLPPMRAFYLATLAGARALDLDDKIGNFLPGKEADFVVLDPEATPLLARRLSKAETLSEMLFVLMMLGDERLVYQTYILGALAHQRVTGTID